MPDSYLALFNNYIPDFVGKEGFNVTCFAVGIIVCIVYVLLVMKNRADRAKKGYSVEAFGGAAVKMVLIIVQSTDQHADNSRNCKFPDQTTYRSRSQWILLLTDVCFFQKSLLPCVKIILFISFKFCYES